MHPPFTAEQFFEVFRRYNEAVWPAQIALILVAALIVFAAYRANVRRSWRWAQVAIVLLAALWLWTGIVYHKHYFATLTIVGQTFGSFFIAEAGLLLIVAWRDGSSFDRASRSAAIAGATIVVYALLLYPAIAMLLGQRYPALPTFGAPCPLTLFTFGIFCLLPASIPRFAIAIPVLWSGIASYAAIGFGVLEDLGLLAAAIAAIVIIRRSNVEQRVPYPLSHPLPTSSTRGERSPS
jgi:hypothetical protein